MIAPAYYRSLLSPTEQDVYKDIVTGLLQRREVICVGPANVSAETLQNTVKAVHLDHPELFYVDFWHYRFSQTLSPCGTFLHFALMLDREPSAAVMNTLNDKAVSLRETVQACPSQEAAYFAIAKEIASTTKYVDSNSAFWDHTVAGPVLCHSAVCEGIAKTFLFLCQRVGAGTPCAIITGTLNGVPHAWNMVELNGVRKYVDVTAALQTISLYSLMPTAFFKSEQALRTSGYRW